MADTLTQLIAKVQAQLLDNGTLFTTATCTAAIRQALHDVNDCVPQNAAALITAIANQKEYELSDEDPSATGITDILLDGDDEYAVGLAYDAYVEDSRWFFRLRAPRTAGETLIVHYTKPHTICGLDGAGDSTLPDALNTSVINGASYYCCVLRAGAGIESNNIQLDVAVNWLKVADIWLDIFNNSLRDARRQPTPRGNPTIRAWNDEWS